MTLRVASALFGLLFALPGRAETAAVVLLDSPGVSSAQRERLVRAAAQQLSAMSTFSVSERDLKIGLTAPRRDCGGDEACVLAVAGSIDVKGVLVLSGKLFKRLSLDAYWVETGSRPLHHALDGASVEAADETVRSLLEVVLPAYSRRGWGGVVVEAAGGARVKLDGKAVATLPVSAPVAATVGSHDVDVVFPGGASVLNRISVEEGKRTSLAVGSAVPVARLEASREAAVEKDQLRFVSYGLWGAGALTLATGFVLHSLALSTRAGTPPCKVDERSCQDVVAAQAAKSRSDNYSRSANILAISGGVLAIGGTALFGVDAYRRSSP